MKKFNTYKLFNISKELLPNIFSIKTYNRNSVILPHFVGKSIQIHNGKDFIKIFIIKEMIGHKLGEFIKTRKTFIFKSKKKKNNGAKS